MTQDHINVGPLRPTVGPLARLGGAAAAQPLGGGSLPNQVGELQQIVRALQDQVYAMSQFFDQLISVPMMLASGDNHQPGVVPDPGSVTGTAKFLREDATWTAVSATALVGIVPVANGGTGTADGSITGTGALTFTSSGANPVVLKPGTNSTTAVQAQTAGGAAVLNVDTTNTRVGVGTVAGTAKLEVSDATNVLGRFAVYNATTAPALVIGRHARGTEAAPTATNNGDFLATFYSEGYDGAAYQLNAAVSSQVVGAVSGGVLPTDLVFFTSPTNSAGLLERFRISSAGLLKLGVLPPIYANNAAAVGGGLTSGMVYRTGADPDPMCIVH